VSTLLIGGGALIVGLAIPATLVGAEAPTRSADRDAGQAVTSQEPVAAPAAQSPGSPTPPSASTPQQNTTTPPADTGSGETVPQPALTGSGSPGAAADTSTTVSAASSASVAILDGTLGSAFRFSPSTITVDTGDTVAWTNDGSEPHDVTGSGLASGILQPGQGYSHTFTNPGTFRYLCSIHPQNMKGTVIVRGSASGGENGGGRGEGGGGSGTLGGGGGSTTGPTSESAAGSLPDAAGTSTQLPSTGMPVLPLLVAGAGLVIAGALLRRRARVS
jgi:plastocyanin